MVAGTLTARPALHLSEVAVDLGTAGGEHRDHPVWPEIDRTREDRVDPGGSGVDQRAAFFFGADFGGLAASR